MRRSLNPAAASPQTLPAPGMPGQPCLAMWMLRALLSSTKTPAREEGEQNLILWLQLSRKGQRCPLGLAGGRASSHVEISSLSKPSSRLGTASQGSSSSCVRWSLSRGAGRGLHFSPQILVGTKLCCLQAPGLSWLPSSAPAKPINRGSSSSVPQQSR